jgi:hypothetical protein
MDTREWLSESNMYVMDRLVQMVQERFTELEHAAGGDRMDTREWLLQKANVLNKLDRLVWYNGSTATYRNRAWCSS